MATPLFSARLCECKQQSSKHRPTGAPVLVLGALALMVATGTTLAQVRLASKADSAPLIPSRTFSTLPSQEDLVCRYEPDRDGARIVLQHDGGIRFIPSQGSSQDTTMRADIFRNTVSGRQYRVLLDGRTDIFEISLKTFSGAQTSSFPGDKKIVYRLSCRH